jgi:hypothetical protein
VNEINKLIAKHNNKLSVHTQQKNEILKKHIQKELQIEIEHQRNYYKERDTNNKIKKDDIINKITLMQKKNTEIKLSSHRNYNSERILILLVYLLNIFLKLYK